MGLGTLVGGWRIVHTVGSKITRQLRRNRRRRHAVCCDLSRHSSVDDAHRYRIGDRRRRRSQGLCRQVERRRQYRNRLDHYVAGRGVDGSSFLRVIRVCPVTLDLPIIKDPQILALILTRLPSLVGNKGPDRQIAIDEETYERTQKAQIAPARSIRRFAVSRQGQIPIGDYVGDVARDAPLDHSKRLA